MLHYYKYLREKKFQEDKSFLFMIDYKLQSLWNMDFNILSYKYENYIFSTCLISR